MRSLRVFSVPSWMKSAQCMSHVRFWRSSAGAANDCRAPGAGRQGAGHEEQGMRGRQGGKEDWAESRVTPGRSGVHTSATAPQSKGLLQARGSPGSEERPRGPWTQPCTHR